MDVLGSGKYLALRLHEKRSVHFLEESESTEWEYSWFWGFRFQPMMRTSYCIVRLSGKISSTLSILPLAFLLSVKHLAVLVLLISIVTLSSLLSQFTLLAPPSPLPPSGITAWYNLVRTRL
ncbi:unnamed protein product [Citrullus colocynthis]|uniref:Uncharacterized protein n=1 Tax=Citrullus colocynthis TaxID=252529 RepID=A0ABP0YFL4_9ROSI